MTAEASDDQRRSPTSSVEPSLPVPAVAAEAEAGGDEVDDGLLDGYLPL